MTIAEAIAHATIALWQRSATFRVVCPPQLRVLIATAIAQDQPDPEPEQLKNGHHR